MPESLKKLIDMIHFLPGIGEKTAAKLAFFLLKANSGYVKNFSETLAWLHINIKECPHCHAMMDVNKDACQICLDVTRDSSILCVVEDYLDMLAIDRTGIFRGKYFILGGAISPISGITPDKLNLDHLFERILTETHITEIILAMNPNIEGEATKLYIKERMPRELKITELSKGLPHAGSIEYADEITLLSAFRGRG